MKCPNCGCKDFYETTLRTGPNCTEGGAWEAIEVSGVPVEAYICKKCGRIELYGLKAKFAIEAQEQEHAKKEEEKAKAENRKAFLLKEKERLEALIKDENQTVRAVNQAKEELEKVRSELRDMGLNLIF